MVARAEGGSRAVGLDYGAAEIGLKLAGIDVAPEVWTQVQLIEIGARAAMNGTDE